MKTSKRIETDAGKSDGTLYAWGRHHSSRLCGSPETALIEGFSERCIATAISETDETFERADLATLTLDGLFESDREVNGAKHRCVW